MDDASPGNLADLKRLARGLIAERSGDLDAILARLA